MKKFSIRKSQSEYVELSAPLKVYYDITTECNLNCVFCFKDKRGACPTWSQVKAVIKKIADASIPDLLFCGGEPFCCPFLFDALQYAKELGLQLGIITNGTHFTEANAKLLKKLVNNSISISVHAHNDALHDKISCGEGIHTKIIEGLYILNAHGIVPELAFTPIKDNIDYLYDTMDGILQKGIQISDILVNRLIPSGNALDCWCDKKVSLKEQNCLFEQMERLSEKYPEIIITTGDSIPFCMFEEKYRKFITRCDFGITIGWIDERNLFGKCLVKGSDGLESLEHNDLKKIWKTSEAFLQHRHMKNLPAECATCAWLLDCGAGCACSCISKSNKDAYLDSDIKFSMPSIEDKDCSREIVVSPLDFDKVSKTETYKLKSKFYIRRESVPKDEFDEVYLLLPISSGAVIQDVITSDSGTILWLNEIEKQIVLYMQLSLPVSEVAKCIAYEFNLDTENAFSNVKNTIAKLQTLEMVEQV